MSAVALALIALAAALAVAVVVRTRRAHRPGTGTSSAAYLPDVTDPRGRWQVTGIVPDLLGPTPYVLNTDHDGPTGTPEHVTDNDHSGR